MYVHICIKLNKVNFFYHYSRKKNLIFKYSCLNYEFFRNIFVWLKMKEANVLLYLFYLPLPLFFTKGRIQRGGGSPGSPPPTQKIEKSWFHVKSCLAGVMSRIYIIIYTDI